MQIYQDQPGYKLGANSITMMFNITGALSAGPIEVINGNTVQVDGTPLDFTSVRAALLAFAPVANAPPGSNFLWPRRGMELDEVGWGVWKASVTYSALNTQYSVKIAGQQQQIRASKQTLTVYQQANAPAPQTNQAIGWDGRTVHGTSIYVPTKSWTETVEIPAASYTFDYEDSLDALLATPVNNASFRGKNAKEVLFLGANISFSATNPDVVQAAFDFAWSKNRTVAGGNPISIGNFNQIEKNGWEYLWVYYTPVVDPNALIVVPSAQAVFIERVYDLGNFATLNIGTSRQLPTWGGS